MRAVALKSAKRQKMRKPTPDPLEWWRRAVIDKSTTRIEGEPHAGFYARRAKKDGPLIPVQVRMVQEIDPETGELTDDERIVAEELGRVRDPMPDWLWLYLRPVTEGEFYALVESHRTDARMSATHAKYDVGLIPSRPVRR